MNKCWLSAYIYFRGAGIHKSACDDVILDVIYPFVRTCERHNWISRYFFVRYNENGPHIRLRLLGEDETLRDTVKPQLKKHVQEALRSDLRPKEHGDEIVHWIPYERETNRYGGQEGVRLAEQFFHCSSEVCFKLLKKSRGQARSSRLGTGLLSMVVLLYAFSRTQEQAVQLMNQYKEGYLRYKVLDDDQASDLQEIFEEMYEQQGETLSRYVNETKSRLERGVPLTDALDVYYRNLIEISDRFHDLFQKGLLAKDQAVLNSWGQAIRTIIPNYLHMNNNRLGITLLEESYLAYLIARTYEESGKSHH